MAPAPAATTKTSAGPLLKELYTLPPVRVLNDKSFLHDKLTKETPEIDSSGKYFRWPVTVRRALGRGSRPDSGVLPNAVAEEIVDATGFIKHHYYALEWSEAVEEASKNKEGAFEKVVTMKMKNVATDMAKELNRQWYNTNRGALGTVSTGVASATQTLVSAQYAQVNDLVDFVSSAGTTLRGTRTITAVDKAAKTVTLDSSVTTTTNDIMVVSGNVNTADGSSYETDGLRFMADKDRVLHGISGVTYDEWDGNVYNVSSAVAGESAFEIIDDKVGERGRGDVDFRITTRGIRRRLADEFASQRRYLNEKATDIKAGYRTIEVNGVETVIDDDCPKGYVLQGAREVLKIAKMTDPGFLESEAGDGAKIELKDDTTAGQKKAVFQTWYRYHCSLICTDPGRLGVIPDAADDF